MKNLEDKASFEKQKMTKVKNEERFFYKVAEKVLKIRKVISDSQPDWYKATYGIFKF
jgi:hypothetical protein